MSSSAVRLSSVARRRAFALSSCVSYTSPSTSRGGGWKAPGDFNHRTALHRRTVVKAVDEVAPVLPFSLSDNLLEVSLGELDFPMKTKRSALLLSCRGKCALLRHTGQPCLWGRAVTLAA